MPRPLNSLILAMLLPGCIPWGLDTDPPWADTDDTAVVPRPDIVVTPSVLSFDIAASEAPVVQVLTLANKGERDVRVYDTAPVDGTVFENVDPIAPPVLVPAGGETTLEIRFSPPSGGAFEDVLALRAPDANGVGDIKLVGTVAGPTVTASSETVSQTLQWCTAEATVNIRNDGPDGMPVQSMRLVERGEQQGCESFALRDDEVDKLELDGVANGELRSFPLDFTPQEPFPQTCTLEIQTSLPNPVRVPLGGVGVPNPRADETWYVSDGTAAHVLLIHDDAATDINGHRERLRSGLDDLVRALDIAGIEFRIAAPSTGDGCSVGSPRFGVRADPVAETVETLERHLFTPETRFAAEPLRLMSNVLGAGAASCFPGWLKSPDPLHVVIISARGDSSGRTVDAWIGDVRTEVPNTKISVVSPQSGCGPSTPRLNEAAGDTGGAIYDLCATDWDRVWAGIAADTAELRQPAWSYELLATPLPGSLRVSVARRATEAWSLGGENGRTLQIESIFADGDEVLVEYADRATCR